ncbi:hypothetical protein B0T26DRAFT_735400 [Lasiosphaeria miniovina]|uniref:Uncharacterized protein n=1 Tax=Lasiosphaeria miniovina TaxID=1954250 RepID=A0AA39ZQT5_9PEZI|nr:uncharacterized protein B0T26DRAFT_735400 [Lasiosphaeria miniovina]KAK0701957.1 hypothetical protein B0T26DRAFT_735400 [Lasiosphaeria miniovina]
MIAFNDWPSIYCRDAGVKHLAGVGVTRSGRPAGLPFWISMPAGLGCTKKVPCNPDR